MKSKEHLHLSRRERQIMDVVYRLGRASAAEILEGMAIALVWLLVGGPRSPRTDGVPLRRAILDYAAITRAFRAATPVEVIRGDGTVQPTRVVPTGSGRRKQRLLELTARLVDAEDLPIDVVIVSSWARTGWNVLTPNVLIDATATRDVTAWQQLRGRAMRPRPTWSAEAQRLVHQLVSGEPMDDLPPEEAALLARVAGTGEPGLPQGRTREALAAAVMLTENKVTRIMELSDCMRWVNYRRGSPERTAAIAGSTGARRQCGLRTRNCWRVRITHDRRGRPANGCAGTVWRAADNRTRGRRCPDHPGLDAGCPPPAGRLRARHRSATEADAPRADVPHRARPSGPNGHCRRGCRRTLSAWPAMPCRNYGGGFFPMTRIFVLVAAVLFIVAGTHAATNSSAQTSDLRMNHVQVLGTHNSYHLEPSPDLLQIIAHSAAGPEL
jgi:hypothetical protein